MQRGWKQWSIYFRLSIGAFLILFQLLPVRVSATGFIEQDALQKQIDQALPGSFLTIPEGMYTGPIRIAKPIRLVAQGSVIISNPSPDPKDEPVVVISSDHVTLQGIAISDKRVNSAEASLVLKGSHNVIEQVHIETMGTGIQLREATNNTLHNISVTGKVKEQSIYGGAVHDHASHGASSANKVAASAQNVPARKGNGIDLFQSHQNRIVANKITNVFDGIYLENSNGNQIVQNKVETSRYGYHFMGTAKTLLQENTGSENVTGAMLMETTQATVLNNQFFKQKNNPSAQGILLYAVTDSQIKSNSIEGNRVGLYLENSTGIDIRDNRLKLNFIGMQVKASSANTFTENLFISNVIQAQAQDSTTDSFRGNYWDNLQTLDTNGDGRSELPYEMNPFYLALTDAVPPYQLFFQAPGFVFLENLFSSVTNAVIRDESPLVAISMNAKDQASGTPWATGILGLLLLAGSTTIMYKGGKRQ